MGGLSVGPWRIVSTTMVALALVTIAPVAASSNSEGAEFSAPNEVSAREGGSGYEQRFENPNGWDLRRLTASVPLSDIVEVVTELEVADDVITVGVLPQPGDEAADIETSILATLDDMVASDATQATADRVPYSALSASYRVARAMAERATPLINRVTLRPDAVTPALLRGSAVDDLSTADSTAMMDGPANQGTALAAAICEDPWWPNYFTVIAQPSTVSGERYGRMYFQWTTNARLERLQACENSSFEPDYVTYNYDDRHYFSSTITSWTSNLPNAYQDTTFLDGTDEPTYTIGTPNTLNLVPDKEYTTYFRAKNGNYSSDTSKANAQRGVRIPSFCYSPWCVFARDTERFPSSGWMAIPSTGWTVYK